MSHRDSLGIPRIFHHVWVSGDDMPDDVLAARQTWIDRHPDWEFRIWRLEDLGWLRNQSLFDRAIPYSQKADFARYEVVHRFGGVYLDTDVECLRPLSPLLDGHDFFAGREPHGNVGSSIFGAIPAHPIVREMIERLPASCFVHPIEQLAVTSGPLLLDRILRDGAWEARDGIRIFPQAYFFPYGFNEPWRRDEAFPRAYAVHHWGHSWKGQQGVVASPADLLPRRGEALLPSARALWRETKHRGATTIRKGLLNLALPGYRFVRKGAGRLVPPSAATFHGIPWGPDETLVATPFGTRLLCSANDLSMGPELALTGTYDVPFVDFIRSRLRPGMTFGVIGANVGFFTILGAARVGPGGRVFAYESDPKLERILRRNIRMNRFSDRVRMITSNARDPEQRKRSLQSITRDSRDDGMLEEFEVPCERIEDGFRDLPYVDLLKVDAGRGEAAVLEASSLLLDQDHLGAMLIEYRANAQRGEHWDDAEKLLTSFAEDRGATLHVPGNSRSIPLDEVLTVCNYSQLLVRFPGASIDV